MRKSLCVLLAMVLAVSAFSGCTVQQNPDADDGKLHVVTTIFAPYDFARQVGGDDVSVRRFAPESGGSAAYQAMDPGHCDAHLHLKCVDCGRLIHLDEDVSDALQSDLLRAAGFTVDGRSTTIYGTCAACGRKRDGHA